MPETQGGGPLGLDAETMLAIGGFVLVFSLVAIAATFFVTPVLAYICLSGGVAPAGIVLGLGILEYHREKQIKEFATWVKAYRRIRMDELASKVGKSPMDAERLLSRAIELGYVAGVVDRSSDEFVLAGTETEQAFVERCPHCGGIVNRWAFPEERFPCPYCSVAVEVPRKPRAPLPQRTDRRVSPSLYSSCKLGRTPPYEVRDWHGDCSRHGSSRTSGRRAAGPTGTTSAACNI